MYEYLAFCTDVYDGDTITVDIDLGFGITMKKQKIRLLGINTPELRGETLEAARVSRDWLKNKILLKVITIKTEKDKKGKYGRYLAEIYFNNETESINQQLLNEGLAKPYGS